MATNRDILKEAIADAKSIKEAAIANAKVALEEAFTPYLKEKLSAKLAEIDSMDEEMDENKATQSSEKETGYKKVAKHQALRNSHYDTLKTEEMDESMDEDMDEEMDEEKAQFEDMDESKEKSMDEMDLDELLKELGMEEENMDEVINDPKGEMAHGNVASNGVNDTDLNEAKGEGDEEDIEIDLENMSEEDLKEFIESVINDMVEAGELEAGHPGMENEPGAEGKEGEENESMYEDMDEAVNPKDSGYTKIAKHQAMKNSDYETMKEEMDEMKKELDEAYKALAQVKSDLMETNLLNAKLLYTNKVFKAKNLTESQKVKVLEAFDKAKTKNEAKLVYETVLESLNNTTKTPVNESVRGMASKVIAGAQNTKQPIIEVNAAFERMQKLAGIKK